MLVIHGGHERTQELQKLIEEDVCGKPRSRHFAPTGIIKMISQVRDTDLSGVEIRVGKPSGVFGE